VRLTHISAMMAELVRNWATLAGAMALSLLI
jgi:hypothetical protein